MILHLKSPLLYHFLSYINKRKNLKIVVYINWHKKEFEKELTSTSDTNCQQVRNGSELPQPDKWHVKQPTTDPILNGERLKAFILKTEVNVQTLALATFIVVNVLADAVNHNKEIKEIQFGKKE